MSIFVTGATGFIGYHLCKALLERGDTVYGIDTNSSPAPWLHERYKKLSVYPKFHFANLDINDTFEIIDFLGKAPISKCVHLAARAGVQGCDEDPRPYIHSNIKGFDSIIEICRVNSLPLIYASSASVYGDHPGIMRESNKTLPKNLYGITKLYNEHLSQDYWKQNELPSIGLRFFNVYGEYGSPDSFLYKLLGADRDSPVRVNGDGGMYRDWTYIDDIVQGIIKALDRKTMEGAEIYNLGNGQPRSTLEAAQLIGNPNYYLDPAFPEGEIRYCFADYDKASKAFGYAPETRLETGIKFVKEWYEAYTAKTTL